MSQVKPKRSIIDIKKFGGEQKENIIEWIDMHLGPPDGSQTQLEFRLPYLVLQF